MSQRNLILVYHKNCVDPADFKEIARIVREKAPDIQMFIVMDSASIPLRVFAAAASRPALIFSPIKLRNFIPARGRIFCGRDFSKILQMQMMRRIGVPVPEWALIEPDSQFRVADWGELVVVKPDGFLASYARGVELRLTESVKFQPPATYPKTHPGHYGPMFVQRFIDTGPYPAKIRVLTLFGTPLYAEEIRSEDPQIIPVPPTAEGLQNVQVTVVNGPRTRRFVFDSDVLDLARKIYGAAPFIPLQGCDFIREAGTGKLYALEFNPGGNTWHFSSKASGHHRVEGKKRQEQFNAFDLAANVLIAQTRERAL